MNASSSNIFTLEFPTTVSWHRFINKTSSASDDSSTLDPVISSSLQLQSLNVISIWTYGENNQKELWIFDWQTRKNQYSDWSTSLLESENGSWSVQTALENRKLTAILFDALKQNLRWKFHKAGILSLGSSFILSSSKNSGTLYNRDSFSSFDLEFFIHGNLVCFFVIVKNTRLSKVKNSELYPEWSLGAVVTVPHRLFGFVEGTAQPLISYTSQKWLKCFNIETSLPSAAHQLFLLDADTFGSPSASANDNVEQSKEEASPLIIQINIGGSIYHFPTDLVFHIACPISSSASVLLSATQRRFFLSSSCHYCNHRFHNKRNTKNCLCALQHSISAFETLLGCHPLFIHRFAKRYSQTRSKFLHVDNIQPNQSTLENVDWLCFYADSLPLLHQCPGNSNTESTTPTSENQNTKENTTPANITSTSAPPTPGPTPTYQPEQGSPSEVVLSEGNPSLENIPLQEDLKSSKSAKRKNDREKVNSQNKTTKRAKQSKSPTKQIDEVIATGTGVPEKAIPLRSNTGSLKLREDDMEDISLTDRDLDSWLGIPSIAKPSQNLPFDTTEAQGIGISQAAEGTQVPSKPEPEFMELETVLTGQTEANTSHITKVEPQKIDTDATVRKSEPENPSVDNVAQQPSDVSAAEVSKESSNGTQVSSSPYFQNTEKELISVSPLRFVCPPSYLPVHPSTESLPPAVSHMKYQYQPDKSDPAKIITSDKTTPSRLTLNEEDSSDSESDDEMFDSSASDSNSDFKQKVANTDEYVDQELKLCYPKFISDIIKRDEPDCIRLGCDIPFITEIDSVFQNSAFFVESDGFISKGLAPEVMHLIAHMAVGFYDSFPYKDLNCSTISKAKVQWFLKARYETRNNLEIDESSTINNSKTVASKLTACESQVESTEFAIDEIHLPGYRTTSEVFQEVLSQVLPIVKEFGFQLHDKNNLDKPASLETWMESVSKSFASNQSTQLLTTFSNFEENGKEAVPQGDSDKSTPFCEKILPPKIVVGYNDSTIGISPLTSLPFWEKLRVSPFAPKKNISYYVTTPNNNDDILFQADHFLKELSAVYEVCNFGKHSPGPGFQNGFVSKATSISTHFYSNINTDDHLGKHPMETVSVILQNFADQFLKLVSELNRMTEVYSENTNSVIYVLNPFVEPASLKMLLQCISYYLLKWSLPMIDSNVNITIQIIPLQQVLLHNQTNLLPLLKEISFSVFLKSRRIRKSLRQQMVSLQDKRIESALTYSQVFEPLFVLAPLEAIPNQASSTVAHTLHCCYAFSDYGISTTDTRLENKWAQSLTKCVIATLTDDRGELLESVVLHVPLGEQSAQMIVQHVAAPIWNFITSTIEALPQPADCEQFQNWDVVVTKFGQLEPFEIKGWQEVIPQKMKPFLQDVHLVDLRYDDSLQVFESQAVPTAINEIDSMKESVSSLLFPPDVPILFSQPWIRPLARSYIVSSLPFHFSSTKEFIHSSSQESCTIKVMINLHWSTKVFVSMETNNPSSLHMFHARHILRQITRQFHDLSWLNVTPCWPVRHSVLPFHIAVNHRINGFAKLFDMNQELDLEKVC